MTRLCLLFYPSKNKQVNRKVCTIRGMLSKLFPYYFYLVSRRLDVQASFGERGLHADEEAPIGRIVSGRMRTRRSC